MNPNFLSGQYGYSNKNGRRSAMIFIGVALITMLISGGAIILKRVLATPEKEPEIVKVLTCGSADASQYVFNNVGKYYYTLQSIDKDGEAHSRITSDRYTRNENTIITTTESSSYDGGPYTEIDSYDSSMELITVYGDQ
jgi:hypothetical protein